MNRRGGVLAVTDSSCGSDVLSRWLPGFEGRLEVVRLSGLPQPDDEAAIGVVLESMLPEFDLVIVVDSGRGEVGPEAVRTILAGARRLAVSGPRTVSDRYSRWDLVVLPPVGPWTWLRQWLGTPDNLTVR